MGFDRVKFLASNSRFKEERKNFEDLPDGVYNFELKDVDDGLSQAGNPRILFTWEVMLGEDDVGRKFFQTFRHDENGYFSLQITLSQLGVKNVEEILPDDDTRKRIFIKLIGSQVRASIKTTEKDGKEYRNIRIAKCFLKKVEDSDLYKDRIPFDVPKTPEVKSQSQSETNAMAEENEKIYLKGCEVVCKLPDQSTRLGEVQIYNAMLNACFVTFKDGTQPQTVPVPNILQVGKPRVPIAGGADFVPGVIKQEEKAPFEEVEEVVEEVSSPKLEVGQNVKFKFKDADMGNGEIHAILPDGHYVKIKQAGKIYTVPIANIALVT